MAARSCCARTWKKSCWKVGGLLEGGWVGGGGGCWAGWAGGWGWGGGLRRRVGVDG